MATTTPKPMTVAERSALLKVVKGRFKVYRGQMKLREQEIKDLIRERIVEESERAVKAATEGSVDLIERYEALMQEAAAFVTEQGEAGVAPGSFQVRTEWKRTGGSRRQPEYEEVQRTVTQPGELLPNLATWMFSNSRDHSLDRRNTWIPAEIEERIEKEYGKLAREKGYAELNLMEREQAIEEEIHLTAIETGTAQQYVAKLPALDTLMPLPTAEELKVITA